jgi:uncharacterized membrane protein (UPF0136 family)
MALEDVMGAATIGLGLALIALGIIAYLASAQESVTALIPAFFGAAMAICGGIALRRRKPGVGAAMVVAALGLVGALSRIVPALMRGEGFVLTLATGVQFAMAILMGVFLGVGARWMWRLGKGYGEQRRTT